MIDTPKQRIILAVACTSVFIEALDIAILNVAFPLIRDYFHFTSENMAWLQTIYVLFYGGFLIPGGKLADSIGQKKIFLTGSLLFLAASAGAGLSGSFAALLAFRALQGLAAALAIPASIAIIRNIFSEDEKRNRALGIFSAFAGVGSGIGLALGGIIATWLGWKWIFFLNIPIVSTVIFLGWRLIPADKRIAAGRPAGYRLGIILTITAVLSSYFIHDLAHIRAHFMMLLAIFILIIVSGAVFLRLNRSAASPLIDFSLFRSRRTATGNMNTFLLGSVFFSYLLLFPLYMQQHLSFTAAQTGMLLFPFSFLSAFAARFCTPWLFRKIGWVRTGMLGTALLCAGALLFALGMACSDPLPLLLMSLVCMSGFGISLTYPSLAVLALQDIPNSSQGVAAGINQTSYFLGAGFGLSVISLLRQVLATTGMVNKDTGPALFLLLAALCALMNFFVFRRRENSEPEAKGSARAFSPSSH